MNPTVAALSTPTGESAVALIRVTGGECARLVRDIFKAEPTPRAALFGKYRALSGELVDEVIYAYFRAPASYTGEDMLEISCHGSPYIAQKILEDLFARGTQAAHAGEFTRRAFMNDKMDLSQAEAVALVIGARSSRSLEAAQKQLSGELGRRIADLSDRLVDAAALMEAYIDFPDEDLPEEDKGKVAAELAAVGAEIGRLIETAKYSPLVHQGINIVMAGAPNAGKSSLMNRLLGDERAIVSPSAGTTRDFITEKIVVGSYCANLTDTAGLRPPEGEIEAAGIRKAVEKISNGDIRLLVLDASAPLPDIPEEVAKTLTGKNTVTAVNKCDLPQARPEMFFEAFAKFNPVETSCETEGGTDALKSAVETLIAKHHICAAADDILVGARHAAALERAKTALKAAAEKIAKGSPSELAASDLREALDALGEIVGKTDSEDILDRIFSKFCIGK